MEIKLKNFGKIKEAEVKLDGLTLIAGKNDTGKSTVGKALFSIISSLKEYPDEFEKIKLDTFYREYFYKLMQVFQRKSDNVTLKKEMENLLPFRFRQQIAKSNLLEVLEKMKLANVAETNEDIKKAIAFLRKEETEIEKIDEISRRASALTFFGNLNNSVYKGDLATIDYKHGDKKILSYEITNNKLKSNFETKNLGMSFNDIVFIDNPYVLENYKKPNSKYTEDLIEKKNNATKKLLTETFYKNILKEFENIFNGGEFVVGKNGELKYKVNNDSDELEIHNIASGTKSFGLLYILLKTGMIGKDSLIVLDEPENHLHPAWQIKYAEIICKMTKDGFTFLITSHSSDFIQAINLFSGKNEIKNKTSFYLAEKIEKTNYSNIKEKTSEMNVIFKNLVDPTDKFFEFLKNE
ncbi:MAG: AAA family ATPase [Alphaproteobacteria bacterium]|nr:MAG: hypothetical protein B6I23_01975 [Rickettsiaceae bacterium 4572_127]